MCEGGEEAILAVCANGFVLAERGIKMYERTIGGSSLLYNNQIDSSLEEIWVDEIWVEETWKETGCSYLPGKLSPNPGYPARPPPCSLDPLRRRFLSPYCCCIRFYLGYPGLRHHRTFALSCSSLVPQAPVRSCLSAPACPLWSWVRGPSSLLLSSGAVTACRR
ncbi:hypothetical protein NDA11_004481 [Ustilago hordei]|uniref:Uncharacterized protein n=1 Tax=Ustilago hordei TaxID=120017 RepID=I2FM02_USTHO|nr:uncharacterized protein UHO2_00117 [Ustilago hordei]KAJ1043558.1 hypothetical protein NDA10_003575 [Ustilago hordei]KAJ1570816.1 hypothetical protein NDA11_004481 [Ustilago hordei]KAJ1587681.1 hypothetical protein NDA15_007556 [Ustilago hordei]KAJ1590291.1 hypothetical protein NDA12_005900 [Ustilago hordei]KAJ1602296.1 hypothetical protein NDA14_003938 [Ustilago hordei]